MKKLPTVFRGAAVAMNLLANAGRCIAPRGAFLQAKRGRKGLSYKGAQLLCSFETEPLPGSYYGRDGMKRGFLSFQWNPLAGFFGFFRRFLRVFTSPRLASSFTQVNAVQRRWRTHPKGGRHGPQFNHMPTEARSAVRVVERTGRYPVLNVDLRFSLVLFC